MMLVFFTSIGLSANFSRLIKGGKPLIVFLFVAGLLIICQNVIGVVGSLALGIHPAYGLLAGSVTLTGGHGTGAAWLIPSFINSIYKVLLKSQWHVQPLV